MQIHSAMRISVLLATILGCVAIGERHERNLRSDMESELESDLFTEDMEFWGRSLEGSSMSMTYDCAIGCNFDLSLVCGDNGITYQNECLAICQDVTVASVGPCAGDTTMLDTSLIDEEGFADRETLDRFHHESLTLVAKRHLHPYDGKESVMTEEEIREQEANPIPDAIGFRERRLCEDRCEYVGNPAVEDLPTDLLELELPPYDPLLEDNENRKLGIYGADTRKKITDTTLFPNRVVGQLQYASGGHCSGTVIYFNAVLTAGHCVHQNGAWSDHTTFTPARYRSITGGLTDLYGKFRVRTMHTYQGWTQYNNSVYDIAVVRYFPRPSDGLTLGRSVGYAGLRYTLWNSVTLDFCSIRGYPGDKPFGEMWTTGRCFPGYQQADNALRVRHYCDTTRGMSGSSLMTDDGFASGAHTTAVSSTVTGRLLYNEASLLNGIHWQRVREWAGIVSLVRSNSP